MMEMEISISHLLFLRVRVDSLVMVPTSTIAYIFLLLKQLSVVRKLSICRSSENAQSISNLERNMDSLLHFVMKVWRGSIESEVSEVS
jgi:hypothetical protein